MNSALNTSDLDDDVIDNNDAIDDDDNDNDNDDGSSTTNNSVATYSKLKNKHQTGGKGLSYRNRSQDNEFIGKSDDNESIENTLVGQSSSSSFLTPVICCILVTETAERFAYFGFRAILVFYFTDALFLSESTSIACFAYTLAVAYYTPLIGSIIADGFLGLYHTILYFAILYLVGLILLTIAAFMERTESESILGKGTTTFIGLLLICIGTGGIKPCVSAFGANQLDSTPGSGSVTYYNIKSDDDPLVEYNENKTYSNSFRLNGQQSFSKNDEWDNVTQSGDNQLIDRNHHQTIIASKTVPKDKYYVPADKDNRLFRQETDHITTRTTQSERGNKTTKEDHIRMFFSYFYFCINLGALTSIAIVPIVKVHYGFGIAFLIPTACMFFAILMFVSKRDQYIYTKKNRQDDGTYTGNNDNSFTSEESYSILSQFRVTLWLLRQHFPSYPNWIVRARATLLTRNGKNHIASTPIPTDDIYDDINIQQDDYVTQELDDKNDFVATDQQIDDAARILHILPIFLMYPIYWCLYDQQGSVWTIQASKMQLHGLTPEQVLLVNPLEIMLFLPLFGRMKVPPLKRMSWGMFLTVVAFFLSGLVESSIKRTEYIDANGTVSSTIDIFWQLPQLTILAIGEIFISVTGLEFAYSTSPERLKALLLGLFLTTTAIGDSIGGILYSTIFVNMNRALAMHMCALLMLVNLRLFLLVAKWYESHSYIDLKRKKTATRLESTIHTSTIQNNDSELEMQPRRVSIT